MTNQVQTKHCTIEFIIDDLLCSPAHVMGKIV